MGSDKERGRKACEATSGIAREVWSRRRVLRWILAPALMLPAAASWPADDPPLATEFDDEIPVAVPGRTKPPRVNGHAVNLPEAHDLRVDGEASAREKIPVLLFFDLWDCPYCDRALRENARGEALGKPLVGLMTPDFYGAYLEQAINDATKKLTGA